MQRRGGLQLAESALHWLAFSGRSLVGSHSEARLPHWPRSLSEPVINCSSWSLEFQSALALNARERGIAPATSLARCLHCLRARLGAEFPALASKQLRGGAQTRCSWPAPSWAGLCCICSRTSLPLVHQTFLRPLQTLRYRDRTPKDGCAG